DVGMIEGSQDLRLPLESGQPVRIFGEDLREDLDRHRPIQRRVGPFPHHPHPAFSDLLVQTVMGEPGAGLQIHAMAILTLTNMRASRRLRAAARGMDRTRTSGADPRAS